MIKCNKCGEVKQKTEFYKKYNSKNGYKKRCKECIKKQNRDYRKNIKGYMKCRRCKTVKKKHEFDIIEIDNTHPEPFILWITRL